MKSGIISRRKQEMITFFSSFFVMLMLLVTVNTTGAWCSAAGKKNKFLSYPKSGRSEFGLVIISGILAVIVVLLEYRTLRKSKL